MGRVSVQDTPRIAMQQAVRIHLHQKADINTPWSALGVSLMSRPCADGVRGLTLRSPFDGWGGTYDRTRRAKDDSLVATRISDHTVTDHPCCSRSAFPSAFGLLTEAFAQNSCLSCLHWSRCRKLTGTATDLLSPNSGSQQTCTRMHHRNLGGPSTQCSMSVQWL